MASFCLYYNQALCRSCDQIETDYARQIVLKQDELQGFLSFLGPLPSVKSVTSAQEGFRNRAKMSVTGSWEKPVLGLVGEDDLDQGRELLSCPIHHPKLNALIESMPTWITKYRLEPYRISEQRGELKGLIAYYSPESDQMYLRLVVRSQECIARVRQLLPELQAAFPHLVSLSVNLQPIPHAILEGPEEIFITDRKSIDHAMGDVKLKLSPQAFVQTNFEVAKQLYETAATWIGEAGAVRMLDLYCGQGAFSFIAAARAKEILGIEVNAGAVRMAQETVQSSPAFAHLRFEAADASLVETRAQEFAPDLVLVNPPRKGLAHAAEWIERLGARHLLYSSCSAESLAKDLAVFAGNYRLKRVQLFDMFPHTLHFETLVWMEKKT